jgi:transposase
MIGLYLLLGYYLERSGPVSSLHSTRDAAQKLKVSTRTIRKWIDQFTEYINPECNERGHYMLTEESLNRLQDIKKRLQQPNKTMKQVLDDLYEEKLLVHERDHADSSSAEPIRSETDKQLQKVISHMEGLDCFVEEISERLHQLENHIYAFYKCFEKLEDKLSDLSYDRMTGKELQQILEEIRKRQDQLKAELRNIHFTQRMSSATSAATQESSFTPRRKKKRRFFKLF